MRLSNATIATLPADVLRPNYDRQAVRCGVVHLGIGAFHRAHQALIFERALASGDLRWGIVAASLRSPAARDDLAQQDHLYSIVERDSAGERIQVVGAVQKVLVAPEDPVALIEAIASPDVHIVTLTTTEKGYRLDPSTGALRTQEPDVAADLADLSRPRTAPGFLVAGLKLRRDRKLPALTIMSCDNMPHNGSRLRAATVAMAGAHDTGLAAWIDETICFPGTMVDRIVPATTSQDIDALETRTSLEDRAMVKTEPFLQWVIQESFSGPRPDFESFGVTIVDDVAPWEEAKLRLLNGAHSGIAYLGGLAGIATVDAFVADPCGRRFVERLWDEAQATLSIPSGFDPMTYRAALMSRFANPTLAHATRQIAMDGSQKLPQRLLAPAAARLDRDGPIDALALAIAGWMRWQGGRDDCGLAFVVDDPLAAITGAALASASDIDGQVAALLTIDAIFPPVMARDARFIATLEKWLDILSREGAQAALKQIDCLE